MADDKRTKIGPTGPQRATGSSPVASTEPPVTSPTSYLPQPDVDPLVGQTLAGRYHIGKKLGEGGMGAVYLATHNVLEKQVALKVLHGEFARKADLVERFMQEAKAASRIRHENVIDISDFGTTPEGLVFFAMELLHGHDLHEEIARARLAGQLLPWARSKKIFLQICAALSAAHARGIVHRDLKPENVYLVEFLGDPDFVKLLDFGIAKLTEVAEGDRKLTRTGMLFGTPEYMSPEQARGEPQVDQRVDVYAMGCILFQLVTGRVPFEAENFMGVLSLHLTEPPPTIPGDVFDRIGAPRELAGVIAKALEKDRDQRWQTIDALANAVRVVCGDPPRAADGTGSHAARPASVPAPETTTQRAGTPRSGSQTGRVRTQWTGNLQVPLADDTPVRRRSKLPLILGAIAVIGGAAAVALVATRGGSSEPAVVPVGSQGSQDSQAAVPVPDAAVVPSDVRTLPDEVQLTLDSKPRGAQIKDLTTGAVIGKTPMTLPITPSHSPRQFRLVLRGYSDAVVEVVPDRDKLERTEILDRGTTGVVRQTGSAGSATIASPPDAGVTAIKPPELKPDAAATGSDDDCPELPCLKTMPAPSGSAGAGG